MATVVVQPDLNEVARVAAEMSAQVLTDAVAIRGKASWLLAGGTAPTGTYRLLAEAYKNTVDWSKISLAIGD